MKTLAWTVLILFFPTLYILIYQWFKQREAEFFEEWSKAITKLANRKENRRFLSEGEI